MSRKKLVTWTAAQSVHDRTALTWTVAGTIPVPVERTLGGPGRVLCEAPVLAQRKRRASFASGR